MTLKKNLNPPQFGPYQIAGLLHSESTSKYQSHNQDLQGKTELAQREERLTAEREVAGLILGAGPILGVLK